MGIEKNVTRTPVSESGAVAIPLGRNKSGRVWKTLQTERTSSMNRKGVSLHLSKSFEEHKLIRDQKAIVINLERRLKQEKKEEIQNKKKEAEERKKRKMANEYKTSVYQTVRVFVS